MSFYIQGANVLLGAIGGRGLPAAHPEPTFRCPKLQLAGFVVAPFAESHDVVIIHSMRTPVGICLEHLAGVSSPLQKLLMFSY